MSQAFTLHVDNLKCGGCAHTIEKSLSAIPGVSAISVSPERGEVAFEADPGLRPKVAKTLQSLGYPETGTVSGLTANVASAKSYVSCAIGKVTSA
jgi:copper chaperone